MLFLLGQCCPPAPSQSSGYTFLSHLRTSWEDPELPLSLHQVRSCLFPLSPGPPFIVSPPENITVNISQDALLTCRAEAYPGNLTYTWYWQDENVYFQK